jgi:uncharacterized SAM-binding protein YcdF (DUF218 family)
MLKGENIICISSIDWDFIWQGHQEIMLTFAEAGNRVLFIENTGVRAPGIKDFPRIKNRIKNWFKGVKGIREEIPNLYIFSPLLLPFPYLRIARWINRHLILSILEKWTKIMDFHEAIVWTFLPTPLSMNIIDNLSKKIVIYYCIDNFRVSSDSAKKIQRYEIKLIKQVDLVFVTSQALYDYCSTYNDHVYTFPFAVNFQEFEKVRLEKNIIPEELKNIKRPIIGYVGGVHKWIDRKLIKEVVQNYPEYSFVFVGPLQTDVSLLSSLKNIYFLGKKDHKKIPYFIKYFDVCIIPYLITEYIKNVYPTKLNEYHTMGKPIVSTDFLEISNFNAKNDNLVFIGRTTKEFIDCIQEALNNKDNYLVNKRITSAKNNSWTTRIEEMSDLLKEAIEKKSHKSFNWRESLLKFYRVVHRKVFRLGTVVLAIYLLLFYTPLVWFMASPLKISQSPQKVDAIVVFAGGVGESGKAGQGYEERVQYATELYKQGYAGHLIFSSGYIYAFKEPVVMKALAISLGVPEETIILEDKAKNTYENIKFAKDILDKNNWNNVLLVSSPYHMRRASLVFDKIAKDTKVTYTPIPNSLFYSHPDKDVYGRRVWKRINLQQIKGIFHEYLGILYYWWKGYI